MRLSNAGLLFLMQREAVVLSSYKDAGGVRTVGIGHTAAAGPPDPKPGLKITPDEALALFREDVRAYEQAVGRAVTGPLQQHHFDACVSLCFNIGPRAFEKSTVAKRLNAGDFAGASQAFAMWTKAGGKTLKGLVDRRAQERRVFDRADYGNLDTVPVYDAYPGKARLVPAAAFLGSASGRPPSWELPDPIVPQPAPDGMGAILDQPKETVMAADHKTVEVKSAWYSKINWLSFAGPIASLAAAWGFDLSVEQAGALILGIQTGQSVLTILLRTFFTRSVTPASVGKAG